MKKPNTANTNDVYKLMTCIAGILSNCISQRTLLTIHEISQLDVALTSLKNVIESNQIDYPYLDVLTFEVSCFREKKIPYLEHSSGKMKFATYEEAITENSLISKDGKQIFALNKTNDYQNGNLAIGQVYVGKHEFYSTKLALEHSLKSTAERWHQQLGYIKELLKQKGVLENVYI